MITAMNIALAILVLIAPFAVAGLLGWAAHRSGNLRFHIDQFRVSGPMTGRLFESDPDIARIAHDADAIRTRFEQHPAWPMSGVTGERR
jgi:hypothetical protein